jgi:hypothetical protein
MMIGAAIEMSRTWQRYTGIMPVMRVDDNQED